MIDAYRFAVRSRMCASASAPAMLRRSPAGSAEPGVEVLQPAAIAHREIDDALDREVFEIPPRGDT
jgi:hypothetical protein